MATTAQTLIDKALGALGRLQEGEAASGAARTRALEQLQVMLDRWSLSPLAVKHTVQATHTLTPGTASYTIGTSQTINQTRPIRIEDTCFVRLNGIDDPVHVVGREEYAAISDKAAQGVPSLLYYDTTSALISTIRLWPAPGDAYVLHFDYPALLAAFADVTTSYDLFPGYEAAIWQNLALELWVFYPNPKTQAAIARMANLSRLAIEMSNVRVPVLGRTFGAGSYDGYSDSMR